GIRWRQGAARRGCRRGAIVRRSERPRRGGRTRSDRTRADGTGAGEGERRIEQLDAGSRYLIQQPLRHFAARALLQRPQESQSLIDRRANRLFVPFPRSQAEQSPAIGRKLPGRDAEPAVIGIERQLIHAEDSGQRTARPATVTTNEQPTTAGRNSSTGTES